MKNDFQQFRKEAVWLQNNVKKHWGHEKNVRVSNCRFFDYKDFTLHRFSEQ